jgi:hypothetical protein
VTASRNAANDRSRLCIDDTCSTWSGLLIVRISWLKNPAPPSAARFLGVAGPPVAPEPQRPTPSGSNARATRCRGLLVPGINLVWGWTS